MDQDFHFYGTYYAARSGGFEPADAALIAKAANFVDFCKEEIYAAYWKLVNDTQKTSNYSIVAQLDNPRYTYQGGLFSSLLSPEDGLWCSFHFVPGNYDDPPGTPTKEMVHGQAVASALPPFRKRDTNGGRDVLSSKYPRDQAQKYLDDLRFGNLLTRPQSALSRSLITDTIRGAVDKNRLVSILKCAIGGERILDVNGDDNLRRFRLILLGIRAHAIADTWAHQDFCGLNNVLNTYWDVNYDPHSWNPFKMGFGRQSIDYDDGTTGGWKNTVLSASYKLTNPNFEATPNGTSYLGHGWAGHVPDFGFTKFRYKPCWADPGAGAVVRDNAGEYASAWIELASLFHQANGAGQLQLDTSFQNALGRAKQAIGASCRLAGGTTGRKSAANAWRRAFEEAPPISLDVDQEPDAGAVLGGMIEATPRPDRYGTDYVNIDSDLYLFQIAADYQFQFVKNYLDRHGLYRFTGSWSQQIGALSPNVVQLFDEPGTFVPNSNGQVAYGALYHIRSVGHGTVLDDWGGKTGQDSAALQPDDSPNNPNRIWTLIPNAHGFRIRSVTHGTVLDDWGGKTGQDSAALQPDDSPDSMNRTWTLIPNAHGFRIRSVGHGTILDDWGGKTGQDSAALQPDDSPDSMNRTWMFVRV